MEEKLTIWSYLEPFLLTREPLHLADISQRLKRPHPTVRQYLHLFEQDGILTKTIKGRLTLYALNRSSPLLIDTLVLGEKERLLRVCKKNLLLGELNSFLHQSLSENHKALIFGSSVSDFKKAHDVDLLVVGKQISVAVFENKFNIKIHLIHVNALSTVTDPLREEIRKRHLLIQGSEELLTWLL